MCGHAHIVRWPAGLLETWGWMEWPNTFEPFPRVMYTRTRPLFFKVWLEDGHWMLSPVIQDLALGFWRRHVSRTVSTQDETLPKKTQTAFAKEKNRMLVFRAFYGNTAKANAGHITKLKKKKSAHVSSCHLWSVTFCWTFDDAILFRTVYQLDIPDLLNLRLHYTCTKGRDSSLRLSQCTVCAYSTNANYMPP